MALTRTAHTAHASARPSGPLRGTLRVPGDKSISHRAIILGTLADGTTRVTNLLEGGDILSTIGVMRALGGEIAKTGDTWMVEGVGARGFQQPDTDLDCGNAGTGARLIMGAVAGHAIAATFTGDASLSSRPMERVLGPLREMGASCDSDNGRLPVTIRGGNLEAIRFAPPKASAQVKSAILLAGLRARGHTEVIEAHPTRAHTEVMLRAFGVPVETDGNRVFLGGPAELTATDITVPGDPSSAAFATVAATVIPGSDIILEGVLQHPRRSRLFEALQEMGADITLQNPRTAGGEEVADLRVRHAQLTGTTVDPARAADMIDEYPILAVAAAFADGPTVMDGIGELRVKESDRISATVALLRANGVEVDERDDGMTVHGRGKGGAGDTVPGGSTPVTTHHDHRIAMSALILGLASRDGSRIDDPSPIATSYPGFFDDLTGLGAEFA